MKRKGGFEFGHVSKIFLFVGRNRRQISFYVIQVLLVLAEFFALAHMRFVVARSVAIVFIICPIPFIAVGLLFFELVINSFIILWRSELILIVFSEIIAISKEIFEFWFSGCILHDSLEIFFVGSDLL